MSAECFHHRFEAQAAAGLLSQAIAVECGGTNATYEKLNRQANRLAHRLTSIGVGPDVAVGVFVARSACMLTALLGVAKAGGAYVPIDPGERDDRRRFMIKDAGIRVLVSDGSSTMDRLQSGIATVDISEDTDLHGTASDRNPDMGVTLRDLAYIVYTSGSTGRPKGTAMEHSSLANLIEWHGSSRRESCGLRTLQLCSIGFDFSFHEIFSTLCFGGTLVIADEKARRDPFLLAQIIRHRNIEKVFLPVSTLLQWAAAVDETSFPVHLKHANDCKLLLR
jgi:non-ribosomal peptide synthetase component F